MYRYMPSMQLKSSGTSYRSSFPNTVDPATALMLGPQLTNKYMVRYGRYVAPSHPLTFLAVIKFMGL